MVRAATVVSRRCKLRDDSKSPDADPAKPTSAPRVRLLLVKAAAVATVLVASDGASAGAAAGLADRWSISAASGQG